MKYTPEKLGEVVREARKKLGVTQRELALSSGTGLRFIIDLEHGKPTCQMGKVLTVLQTLGVELELKNATCRSVDEAGRRLNATGRSLKRNRQEPKRNRQEPKRNRQEPKRNRQEP